MFQTYLQQSQITDTVVPILKDTAEAYLLLEAAHADRQVHLTRRELALQIVHCNTLALQYNRMLLKHKRICVQQIVPSATFAL